MEAAPAVTIEITSWPALCDETGKAAESSSAGWEPGEGLTRREANMFLRGMKRCALFPIVHRVYFKAHHQTLQLHV